MERKEGSQELIGVQMLMMMTRQWEADGGCLLRPTIHSAWLSETTPCGLHNFDQPSAR
jgi:hypothetical protein